jgi:hypothetical protein
MASKFRLLLFVLKFRVLKNVVDSAVPPSKIPADATLACADSKGLVVDAVAAVLSPKPGAAVIVVDVTVCDALTV